MGVNFNQPMCDECWYALFDNTPIRLREPEKEICAWCGRETDSGIYVRAAPEDVSFPLITD